MKISHPSLPLYADVQCTATRFQLATMSLATKLESQKIFEKLKSKPANKVRCPPPEQPVRLQADDLLGLF